MTGMGTPKAVDYQDIVRETFDLFDKVQLMVIVLDGNPAIVAIFVI